MINKNKLFIILGVITISIFIVTCSIDNPTEVTDEQASIDQDNVGYFSALEFEIPTETVDFTDILNAEKKLNFEVLSNFNWEIRIGVDDGVWSGRRIGYGCFDYDNFKWRYNDHSTYTTGNSCFFHYNQQTGEYEMYIAKRDFIPGEWSWGLPDLPDENKFQNSEFIYFGNLSKIMNNTTTTKSRYKRNILSFIADLISFSKPTPVLAAPPKGQSVDYALEATKYFYQYFKFIKTGGINDKSYSTMEPSKVLYDIFLAAYSKSKNFRALFHAWIDKHRKKVIRIDYRDTKEELDPSTSFHKHTKHDVAQKATALIKLSRALVGTEYFSYPLPYSFGVFSLERIFIHELIHAFTEYSDPLKFPESPNIGGPVVKLTNKVLKQMGLPDKPRSLYLHPSPENKKKVAKYYRDEHKKK